MTGGVLHPDRHGVQNVLVSAAHVADSRWENDQALQMNKIQFPAREPMSGLMMPEPMLLSRLIDYAAEYHGLREVVARDVDDSIRRSNWRDIRAGAARLAHALRALGLHAGSRVASLAWNTTQHLEVYYAVLGLGMPLHTLNPRLTANDLRYMVELAEDDVCFFDAANSELARTLAPLVPSVRCWIFLGEGGPEHPEDFPALLTVRDIAANMSTHITWPEFDENRAATICFTSGTTGRPKGVVYSHRSIMLSSMNMSMADMYAVAKPGEKTCVMPIAAMFHANAWMMPFSAAMNGQKLVLPGRRLDAAHVLDLILAEHVTMAGAVPTIWSDIVSQMRSRGLASCSLHTALVAGAVLSPDLDAALASLGITTRQSWGMTEAPGAARGAPAWGTAEQKTSAANALARYQGRVGFQARMRITDEGGSPLPHDGTAVGHLQVQGPTVLSRYLGEQRSLGRDWLDTGDIAVIHPDSTVCIVDRAKDVIKSGGEWISSPQLEAAATSHPAIRAAAAIAVPHERWQERPLLVCVLAPALQVTKEALQAHLRTCVAKWWVPDDIHFVASLPLTPAGKIDKAALRKQFCSER